MAYNSSFSFVALSFMCDWLDQQRSVSATWSLFSNDAPSTPELISLSFYCCLPNLKLVPSDVTELKTTLKELDPLTQHILDTV